MKLTETAILRNFMQIITENEKLANLDKNKLEAIENIAKKHTGVVYYSQIAGLFDVPRTSDEKIKAVFDNMELEKNIRLVDDLDNIPIPSVSPADLTDEQKQIYKFYLKAARNNINNNVVSAILLNGFGTGKIDEKQWVTLTSNLLSDEWTNERAQPAFVAGKLTQAGVEVDDRKTQDQKIKTTKSSRGPQRLNTRETDPKKILDFLVANAADDKVDLVRQILSAAIRERESNIAKNTPLSQTKIGPVWAMIPAQDSAKLMTNVNYKSDNLARALRNIGIVMS